MTGLMRRKGVPSKYPGAYASLVPIISGSAALLLSSVFGTAVGRAAPHITRPPVTHGLSIRRLRSGDRFNWYVENHSKSYIEHSVIAPQRVTSPSGLKCLLVQLDTSGSYKVRDTMRNAIYQDSTGTMYGAGLAHKDRPFIWGRSPMPLELMFRSPLRPGDHWVTRPTFADGLKRVKSVIVGAISTLHVRAGTFRVIVLHETFERRRGSKAPDRGTETIWVAPSLGAAVMSDVEHQGEHVVMELASYQLAR